MTANISQALTTMDVSGRFIMCVFNKSLPKAGCLVKYNPVRLPHDIVQTRKQDAGAPLPAMWLLHTVYQTNPGRVMHLPQGSPDYI